MFQQSSEQILNDFSKYRSAVMGVYILSIALFHQHFLHSFPWNIFHYYGYWGVDVFLLLSGMGMVNALSKYPISIFFQHRIKRLLPSCIFCGILKCAIYLLIGSVIIIPKEIDLIDWDSPLSLDLWYIRAIITYYIISPLLYRFLQHSTWITITAISFLFIINELLLKTSDAGSPSWVIERLLVFCIGMLLAIRKDLLSSFIHVSTIFLLFAITIVAILKNNEQSYSALLWTIYFFSLAFGAYALTYLSIFCLKLLPSTIIRVLNWLGNLSLEIYLIHQFIYRALPLLTGNIHPIAILAFNIILSILIAYICKKVITKGEEPNCVSFH